jgi:hypothetical protein
MRPLKLSFAAVLISTLCFTSFAVAGQDEPGFQSPGACEFTDLIATGMMVKFDDNADGRLNLAESLSALPQFTGSLKLHYDSDYFIEGAYTYALRYGRLPEKDYSGVLHFSSWLSKKPVWRAHLGNLELARVTVAIASILCAN